MLHKNLLARRIGGKWSLMAYYEIGKFFKWDGPHSFDDGGDDMCFWKKMVQPTRGRYGIVVFLGGVMLWWGLGGEPSSMGAGCESSSLASEVEGVEMVVQGRVLGLNQELMDDIFRERGKRLGEVWTVKVEQTWKGSGGASTVSIWIPDRSKVGWPESGRILVLLDQSSLNIKGIWEVRRSECSGNIRILSVQPLTSKEREVLAQVRFSKDPFCQRALSQSRELKRWSREEVEAMEELSQRCGFTWCNPQYCH